MTRREDETKKGTFVGILADLEGFTFALILVPPSSWAENPFNEVWYRPRQIWVRRGVTRRVVEFTWPGENRRDIVHLVAPANDSRMT